MRIGSLFSGIGGLELGLEAALGAETVWQVERDPFARRILAKHWPNADRRITDVRAAHRTYAAHDGAPFVAGPLAPVDIICGGFPCQDVSLAGKGAGLAGAKSGLWFEYLRLVRELRPRWVVIENVASLRGRGLDAVLWGLAEAGYDAEWQVFGAHDVGAPHRRLRMFIIASLPDAMCIERSRRENKAGRPVSRRCCRISDAISVDLRQQQGGSCGPLRSGEALAGVDGAPESVADSIRHRPQGLLLPGAAARAAARSCAGFWASEPRVGGAVDGPPDGVDGSRWPVSAWERGVPRVTTRRDHRAARLRCLGNAVVPQCAYQVGLRIMDMIGGAA